MTRSICSDFMPGSIGASIYGILTCQDSNGCTVLFGMGIVMASMELYIWLCIPRTLSRICDGNFAFILLIAERSTNRFVLSTAKPGGNERNKLIVSLSTFSVFPRMSIAILVAPNAVRMRVLSEGGVV